MLRKALNGVVTVALLLLCTTAAFAQVDRATLTGVVRDPSNAVIPKAKITLTSIATGVTSSAVATGEGTYLIVNLMPGEYLVQAEAAGFQRYEQTVQIELGSRARLGMSLTVGSIGETVK